MERRSFIAGITTLASILGLGRRVRALPAPPKLVLLVRPQDMFDWTLRTSNGVAYVRGGPPKEIKGVLRVNRSTMRLYFASGDPKLPKIDRIEADPALVSAPESTWRLVERAN